MGKGSSGRGNSINRLPEGMQKVVRRMHDEGWVQTVFGQQMLPGKKLEETTRKFIKIVKEEAKTKPVARQWADLIK